MKLTLLSTATLMGLVSLSTSQPLPDTNSNTNVVPVRWNDVEAGVQAAQSSASASASVLLNAREIAPEPELDQYRSKSGVKAGGRRGGSGLWGRAPEPKPKKHHGNGNVKPEKKIEGTNPFDEGGDHRWDPSWG